MIAHPFFRAAVLPLLCAFPLLLHADTLRLKSGETVSGTVQGCDGERVTVALQLGAGNATVPYPLALIDRVTLDRSPAEEALLHAPPQSTDLPAWHAFWDRRAPLLKVPGSDAGTVGLGLAQLLLETDPAQAGTVAATIAATDWDSAQREQARALGAAALLAQGKEADAETAARALLANVSDPAARIDARFVLGRIAASRWQTFATAHPHGQDTPAQAAAQQTLADQALDAFAAAPVFLPSDAARAGRGLLAAAQTAVSADRPREAAALLDDLLESFPTAPQAAEAKTLRQRLDTAGLITAVSPS